MLLTESGITFRGIRPLQRLGFAAQGFYLSNPFSHLGKPARIPRRLTIVPPDPWPGDAQRGRELIAGVFRFAGQTIEKDDLSWRPRGARPEWMAAAHGFEWLRDLRSTGSDRARRMAREMVASWMDMHVKPEEIVWRADIVGARLTAWIAFHDFFCASADDTFRKNYFTSVVRQAKYLSRALPGGLTGLPLMKALKGLAFSGLALEDGEERLEQAFEMILSEIKTQILPDGAHVSRAPQQTFEFLQILVDLRAALIAARLDLPEEVQHAIDRIAPAVKFFRLAEGGLGHFNGGQEGNAHLIETTIMQSGAKGRAMRALPHCGFERIQMGRASLVMDAGTVLDSRHAGRIHAGALSFEYAYGRDRVIVNCGSSDVAGTWREMLRTTAAHSTLTVDNKNAASLDGENPAASRPDVRIKRTEDGDTALLDALHTGYVPRFGLTHRRRVAFSDLGDTLTGEDILSGRAGTPFAVRFHLHPCVQASAIKDGEEILLRARSGAGWKFSAQGLTMNIEESVYCPEGDAPRHTQQIVLSGETAGVDTRIGWALRREKI